MSLPDFLLYLAIGRLLTWLLQTNGLTKRMWGLHPLLEELGDCDLCLGFWVYLALGLFLPPVFAPWPFALSVVVLAAVMTTMAHLLRLGWQAKFGMIVVD